MRDGVNAVSLALMAGVTLQLARAALIDTLTVAVAAAALVALVRFRVNPGRPSATEQEPDVVQQVIDGASKGQPHPEAAGPIDQQHGGRMHHLVPAWVVRGPGDLLGHNAPCLKHLLHLLGCPGQGDDRRIEGLKIPSEALGGVPLRIHGHKNKPQRLRRRRALELASRLSELGKGGGADVGTVGVAEEDGRHLTPQIGERKRLPVLVDQGKVWRRSRGIDGLSLERIGRAPHHRPDRGCNREDAEPE